MLGLFRCGDMEFLVVIGVVLSVSVGDRGVVRVGLEV